MVSKTAYLSQTLLFCVARCFRLFFWATVKLLSTQCSEKCYNSGAEVPRGDRVRNIGCCAVVTASLFCYSPRVFESVHRLVVVVKAVIKSI
jgi:hypothetical protein